MEEGKTIYREIDGKTVIQDVTYFPTTTTTTLQGEEEAPANLKEYEWETIAQHCNKSDCWVVIHDYVYDISSFIERHPGGWLPIFNVMGQQAQQHQPVTDVFEAYHPGNVSKAILPKFMIGKLKKKLARGREEEGGVSWKNALLVEDACRAVRMELLRLNAFETSAWFYVKDAIRLSGLFALALLFTLRTTEQTILSNWNLLLGAFFMGLFWQQLAFIGHDTGHNAISHRRKWDLFYGILFGNPLMGISLGWWKQSHNVHHVVTNSVENDPDIQHLPVFAVSEQIFLPGGKSFYSTYHKKMFNFDLVSRLLVSNQHWLFYPVMALARLNLYAQSWVHLILQPHGATPYRYLEMATLLLFAFWVIALTRFLPDPNRQGFAWVMLAHAVGGILHVQITISHFPMEVHLEGDPNRHVGWYASQMQTTMGVKCHPWIDWFHGGLQFQIEHHMFPRLPRCSLRLARELLLKKLGQLYAADEQIREDYTYVETDFFSANRLLLTSMKRAAVEASMLGKSVNYENNESPLDVSKKATLWKRMLAKSYLYKGSNLEG